MAVIYDEHPHPLRIARQKRGLSIYELEALTGIFASSLSLIENHKRHRVFVDQLFVCAKILGVPWQTLADRNNLDPPDKQEKITKRRRKKRPVEAQEGNS